MSLVTRKTHEKPLIEGNATFKSLTEQISAVTETWKVPTEWIVGFLLAVSFLAVLGGSVETAVLGRNRYWGLQIPNAWGFAIVNFVWWVGDWARWNIDFGNFVSFPTKMENIHQPRF